MGSARILINGKCTSTLCKNAFHVLNLFQISSIWDHCRLFVITCIKCLEWKGWMLLSYILYSTPNATYSQFIVDLQIDAFFLGNHPFVFKLFNFSLSRSSTKYITVVLYSKLWASLNYIFPHSELFIPYWNSVK